MYSPSALPCALVWLRRAEPELYFASKVDTLRTPQVKTVTAFATSDLKMPFRIQNRLFPNSYILKHERQFCARFCS